MRFCLGLVFTGLLLAQSSTDEFTARFSRQRFGVQSANGQSLPRPFYFQEEYQLARRSDGASVMIGSRMRTMLFPLQQRMVLVDRQNARSTVRAWIQSPSTELVSREPACRDRVRARPGNVEFGGWDTIAGTPVARYEIVWGDSHVTSYYAPEFNCMQLKVVEREMIWHGIPLVVTIDEAKEIRRGRPDAEWFRVPGQ